jgi:hypothetical protein
MLRGELTEDGTVDPMFLRAVLSRFAATLRVLTKEAGQDPQEMWSNIQLDEPTCTTTAPGHAANGIDASRLEIVQILPNSWTSTLRA